MIQEREIEMQRLRREHQLQEQQLVGKAEAAAAETEKMAETLKALNGIFRQMRDDVETIRTAGFVLFAYFYIVRPPRCQRPVGNCLS